MSTSTDARSHSAHPTASGLRTAGYAVFPNVLPPDQICRLRAIVQSHLSASGRPRYGGRYTLRGMNREPELARILCSDAIIGVMKACASPEMPVLTGECDLMADTTSGWHKDITEDMGLGHGIYGDEAFRVYKLAVYLQDQPATSRAALKVRPGTHLHSIGRAATTTALPIHSGDVLVFDVRIDHAGQFPTLLERLVHRAVASIAPALRIDAEAAYSRARRAVHALTTGRRNRRLAVFLTFGPDTPALHAYEKAGRRRHGTIPAELDRSAAAALSTHGVKIIQAG